MGIPRTVVAIGLRLKGRALAAAVCGSLFVGGAGASALALTSSPMTQVKATVDPGQANAKGHSKAGAARFLLNLEQIALKTAAQQLNLTPKQLRQQLATGQTLSQIAGTNSQGVQDAIYAAVKQKLDAAVSAGKLTSDKETKLLARIQQQLPKLMNRSFKHTPRQPKPSPGSSAPVIPFANTSAV